MISCLQLKNTAESKMNPKVSVVIASYNTEKYIVECVNSVFNQDYPNVELVVVNDGSTDATGALLGRCE